VLDVLSMVGILRCKLVDALMEPNLKVLLDERESLHDLGTYKRLVEKVNYLTITQPDISYSTRFF